MNGEKHLNFLKSQLEIHMRVYTAIFSCMVVLHVIEAR